MTGFLLAVLGFVLAIGILVTVHEFGHYSVARLCGIRVLRFSIGFGRPLWSRRMGSDETEYRVGMIPLGGYVKMLDEREGPVAEEDRPRAFNRQSIPRRTAVVLAGPAFNFLFAILAYWLVFIAGVPGVKPVIGEVVPGSHAEAAGFQAEDEIDAIRDRSVATWQKANIEMLDAILSEDVVDVRVQRGAERRQLPLTVPADERRALTEPGELMEGLGLRPWFAALPPQIGELNEDGAGYRAGLREGDRIRSVDDTPIPTWQVLRDRVAEAPGRELRLTVDRDGERLEIAVTPERVETDEGEQGRLGVAPRVSQEMIDSMRADQRYGPLAALGQGIGNTWEMTSLTVRMLGRMVMGEVSVQNISGPINIAQYAGVTVSSGLVSFLSFLAIVSISLGIVNLLPIPVLDGGHLLYLAAEGVTGKPPSERSLLIGQQIGLLAIAALITFAIANDLFRIFA